MFIKRFLKLERINPIHLRKKIGLKRKFKSKNFLSKKINNNLYFRNPLIILLILKIISLLGVFLSTITLPEFSHHDLG